MYVNTYQSLGIAILANDDSFQSYNDEMVGWVQWETHNCNEDEVESYYQVTSLRWWVIST